MRKQLTRIGNSLGLVIDKTTLDLLGISVETELELWTDGSRLIVEPVDVGHKKRVLDAYKFVLSKHRDVFERLAKK